MLYRYLKRKPEA